MQEGLRRTGRSSGAGVRPYDAAMREKLLAQDCLTTLIELAPDGISAEVTGAMIDYLPIEEGNGALIRAMADPAIRIVVADRDRGRVLHRPRDGRASTSRIPTCATMRPTPIAAHGLRRDGGGAAPAARGGPRPFTGLSCDNLTGNGAILRHGW
jgi:mannitol 2-dehydrogenase